MILVVNELYAKNIGDHAINTGLSKLFESKKLVFESVAFSTYKNIKKFNLNSNRTNRFKSIRKRLKSFKLLSFFYWFLENRYRVENSIRNNEVTCIVIGGGQLILSNPTFPIAMYTWIKYAVKHGKKVYLAGVGCGEEFTAIERFILKRALRKPSRILVRETDSIRKLREKFNVESEFIPDLAFGLSPIYTPVKNRNKVVVSVTDYNVYKRYSSELNLNKIKEDEYLDEWQRKILYLIDKNDDIYFLSTTLSDLKITTKLYERMQRLSLSNNLVNIDSLLDLGEYRKILSEAQLVFSGRMHSLILAKIEGCKVEPWVISKKIAFYLSDYGDRRADELNNQLRNFLEDVECREY